MNVKDVCQRVLKPENQIRQVHYFTARVSDTKSDPTKSTRQDSYLRALTHEIEEFKAHFGHFSTHTVSMPSARNHHVKLDVIKTEEKGSDVNLAVHLLNDAWSNKYDCAIVLSNDSDLAEAIKLAREKGKIIGVVTTKNRPTASLRKEANFFRRIKNSDLAKSQMPATIQGTTISKPSHW